jgi:hypothetical protein
MRLSLAQIFDTQSDMYSLEQARLCVKEYIPHGRADIPFSGFLRAGD